MKPLTVEELKALQVGDWVWIIKTENAYKPDSGNYYPLVKNDSTILVGQTFDNWKVSFNYLEYGDTWIAYKNKEQAESKGEWDDKHLYKAAFEAILQDVYENRLKADILSCSSCPYMEELFDECQNQGLYEDCKKRWQDYYLKQAEARLKELRGEK